MQKKNKTILAIETSCDETSIALLQVAINKKSTKFTILAHQIASQITLHQKYGGVFPMMAKREHAKNILPLFIHSLKKAKLFKKTSAPFLKAKSQQLTAILDREPELLTQMLKDMPNIAKPDIDLITVTTGPGLEPALWVGINFAKALSYIWNIPVVPTNHMEGHIFSIFPETGKKEFTIPKLDFPIISLLVSGGHTELILMKGADKYKILGQTRDDAAGEAFDKVARMLELPYPGGPQISKLAILDRRLNKKSLIKLPRPMLSSKDFDFSFSGLKTAVLYMIRDLGTLDKKQKMNIAREFEDAVVDVLIAKTKKALLQNKATTLIVGGGVAANIELRRRLKKEIGKNVTIHFPIKTLTGDNALMIGIAGYFQSLKKQKVQINSLKAQGNLSL